MTAWIITTDRVSDGDDKGFNAAGSYSDEQCDELERRLKAGEGQPFIMGSDDWDYLASDAGDNRDELFYRGRVIFNDDADAEAGCHEDNMLVAWGDHHAGATKLIVSPGDTSVPRKQWEYRGL